MGTDPHRACAGQYVRSVIVGCSMCYMCDENGGEPECCQDCGVAICFDATDNHGWPEPAGVTTSGDLFCLRHAIEYDEAEEAELERDPANWIPLPDEAYMEYDGQPDPETEEEIDPEYWEPLTDFD